MNKEKFQAMAKGLTDLIADYGVCKSELAKLQLEELIIKYVDNFLKVYRGEAITAKPRKSEMACNCKREDKTFILVIDRKEN